MDQGSFEAVVGLLRFAVGASVVVGVVGLASLAYCWYNFQRVLRFFEEVDSKFDQYLSSREHWTSVAKQAISIAPESLKSAADCAYALESLLGSLRQAGGLTKVLSKFSQPEVKEGQVNATDVSSSKQ